MADLVASQTLYDGPNEIVIKLTNISDGVGEVAVLKVDASTFDGAPAEVALVRIAYSMFGMGADILWDATTPLLAWHLATDTQGVIDFGHAHHLINNAGAGKTGDIKLTTVGATAGDRYTIILYLRKRSA